mmetsp:Transcript_46725/g.150163  ORF Transcript_46725/g.150163 Transcript_46725/m.150163 type:complete len:232 (+) Transcript_46725:1293-1988(+)
MHRGGHWILPGCRVCLSGCALWAAAASLSRPQLLTPASRWGNNSCPDGTWKQDPLRQLRCRRQWPCLISAMLLTMRRTIGQRPPLGRGAETLGDRLLRSSPRNAWFRPHVCRRCRAPAPRRRSPHHRRPYPGEPPHPRRRVRTTTTTSCGARAGSPGTTQRWRPLLSLSALGPASPSSAGSLAAPPRAISAQPRWCPALPVLATTVTPGRGVTPLAARARPLVHRARVQPS